MDVIIKILLGLLIAAGLALFAGWVAFVALHFIWPACPWNYWQSLVFMGLVSFLTGGSRVASSVGK